MCLTVRVGLCVLCFCVLFFPTGVRRIAKGFYRTRTLKHLSLLNVKIKTDAASVLLDSMTQSSIETLLLRHDGLRLVETYKYYQSIPNIDAKLLAQIDLVGKRNKMNNERRGSMAEL